MNGEDDLLSPPKRLAIAYAKGDSKSCLELLLKFDARLGQVVQRTNEAIVGQMRMAWWRDVIAKEADARPSGEPLVAELGLLEASADKEALSGALTVIIDAWDLLLASEVWSNDVKLEHSKLRSKAIFGVFAELTDERNPEGVDIFGRQWALLDLHNLMQADVSEALEHVQEGMKKLARQYRPLSLLHMAARQQYESSGRLSGLRLAWHGLTGR